MPAGARQWSGPWYPRPAVAKRSPILGYNHNVRYRGLIFHVQTEDSGQASPHLFTHLFYGGVIISTRKLVYDAGSAEDSIKGLMQSQHKVVMKDLKRGAFDDKIDQYLGGTEGLLPRNATDIPTGDDGDGPRPSAPEISISRPGTEQDVSPPLMEDEPPMQAAPPPAPPPVMARTQTAERKSAPSKVRTNLPPDPPSHDEIDPPTLTDDLDGIAAAVSAANATVSAVADAAANATVKTQIQIVDSGAILALDLDDDDDDIIQLSQPRRKPDDTQVQPGRAPTSDGIPSAPIGQSVSRGNALGAASLPPARPIQRPPSRQAITPPQVTTRPVTSDDGRSRSESDVIEVYAPAPPSVEPPPGAAPSERPGQYAQHKRGSQKLPVEAIKPPSERSGSIPIPAGLSRPVRPSANPPSHERSGPIPQRVHREPSSGAHRQPPPIPSRVGTPAGPTRAPDAASRPEQRPRSPTPARVSQSNATPSRTPSANSGSGGVVMTRPAVIVGAPAKPSAPARVRKAREEEGRGFGQGLISEKSLDEVILAYLSEDADDK